MSIFSSIKNIFVTVSAKIHPAIVAIFGKDGADAIGKAVMAGVSSSLGQVALSTVQAMMTLKVGGIEATSAQKREEAFKQILTTAKTSGMQVADSTVNLLIELAVQRLKNITPAN